jgi:hypothetical protein
VNDPAMFPPVSARTIPMSKMYEAPQFRARPQTKDDKQGRKPRWTVAKLKTPPSCDECFAVQWESKGAFSPRADVKHRRTFKDGTMLGLCNLHADAWHERDEIDLKPKKGRGKR